MTAYSNNFFELIVSLTWISWDLSGWRKWGPTKRSQELGLCFVTTSWSEQANHGAHRRDQTGQYEHMRVHVRRYYQPEEAIAGSQGLIYAEPKF